MANKRTTKLDSEAVSVAIAGFLACHVLTCRFLTDEGLINKDRFVAYLEAAVQEMTPGMDDRRALLGVGELIDALRANTVSAGGTDGRSE